MQMAYWWSSKRQLCTKNPSRLIIPRAGHAFLGFNEGRMVCEFCGWDWGESQILFGLN
jgi:hypothetical protein